MARYRLQISAVISALLAFLWARRRIRASRAAAARVPGREGEIPSTKGTLSV